MGELRGLWKPPASDDPRDPPPASSSVLRALRYRADEVQFGRVLHAVCQQEPVARKLVDALLERAAQSGSTHAEALLRELPANIRCQEQTDLFADVGRIAMLRQTRAVGAVDLVFVGDDGWRLLVELKIDSGFGKRQRERYLASRQPLLVIVRDPAAARGLAVNAAEAHNWLGAVGWSDLLETLLELPIEPEEERERWRSLLRIMETDGDFSTRKLPREAADEAARALLQAALSPALEALRETLVRVHGSRGRGLADRLAHGVPRGRDGWAGCALHFGDPGQERFWVAVRNARSAAPTARVWWYPRAGFRERRRVGEARQRVEALGFARRPNEQWLREEPLSSTLVRAQGAEVVLARFLTESLTAIVDAGGLRGDL